MALRALRHGADSGFTIIELLVVSAILVILTGVILVNNSRFGGKILLESLAYEIGLTVRQAQIYGISVRRFGSGYDTGYGLHFERSSPAAYFLFADKNGNGLYDTGAGELVQSIAIERGYRISELCVTPPHGAQEDCSPARLDILFKRPEPDAWITENGSTPSCVSGGACAEKARVRVVSPRGDRASTVIWVNGQVSVEKQ